MEHPRRESTVIRAALLLAALLALPVLAWAPPPKPLLLPDVVKAVKAQRVPPLAEVPLAAMTALWARECSLRTVCAAGDDGTSYGPYQIKAVAAARHCPDVRNWHEGRGNATCALRILRYGLARCGTLRAAFTHYQYPERLRTLGCKRVIFYAWETYELMLRTIFEVQR